MKNLVLQLPVALAAAVLLAGCAGVTITDPDTKAATGLPVRLPEPYLLVTLPLEEGKPAGAQIITLPTGKELIFTPRAGLGSASLKFDLGNNGALSSWGLDTDSKVPETMTAATALLAALKDPDDSPESRGKDLLNKVKQNPDDLAVLMRLYRIVPNGDKPPRLERVQ